MHAHELRVLYADTDAAGIVYHATYLRYFEAARGELLRAGGIPYAAIEERGFFWPVVETWTRHHLPARYDDLLRLDVWVAALGGASTTLGYAVRRGPDLLCEGETRLACVRKGGGVERIPEDLRDLFKQHLVRSGPGRARRGSR